MKTHCTKHRLAERRHLIPADIYYLCGRWLLDGGSSQSFYWTKRAFLRSTRSDKCKTCLGIARKDRNT